MGETARGDDPKEMKLHGGGWVLQDSGPRTRCELTRSAVSVDKPGSSQIAFGCGADLSVCVCAEFGQLQGRFL